MFVENTKNNCDVKKAVASMAIEDMYFDEQFILETIKISNGERTSEELRREILNLMADKTYCYPDSNVLINKLDIRNG